MTPGRAPCWALLLCLVGALVLRSGATRLLGDGDSSQSDEVADLGEGIPAGQEAFRADVVCRARCLAKCLTNVATVSGTNTSCEVICSSYNETWLRDTCTTSSCQETCDNLTSMSGPLPTRPLFHNVTIRDGRLAIGWDFHDQDAVIVVRHSNDTSGPWQYSLSTQPNETFHLDVRRVCAKRFQIAAVNQYSRIQSSRIETLSLYPAVVPGTFQVSDVELSETYEVTVLLEWQKTSGQLPPISYSLRTLTVACADSTGRTGASRIGQRDDLPVTNRKVKEKSGMLKDNCRVVYQLLGRFGQCYDTEPVRTTHKYDCRKFPKIEDYCTFPPTPSVDESTVTVVRNGNAMTVSWDPVNSTEDQVVYGYKVQVGEYEDGLVLKNGTTKIYHIAGKGNHTLNLVGLVSGLRYGVQVLADLGGNDSIFDTVKIHAFTMVVEATSPRYRIALPTSSPSSVVVPRPFAVAGGTVAAAVALLLPALALLLRRCCRRKRSRVAKRSLRRDEESMSNVYSINPSSQLTQASPEPPTPDRWEVAYERLDMGPVLGKGQFGIVAKACISGKLLVHCTSGTSLFRDSVKRQSMDVAVKMLHDGADDLQRREFRSEMKLMKAIGHHSNLVSLLGCCTSEAGPLCLIVEHCCHGDLLHFLRANRGVMMHTDQEPRPEGVDSDVLTANDLLSFASQIARGMEYLSQKGYIHRDLAARNVLVADNKTVKIGDFGLTRYVFDDHLYVHRRGGKLPIKWMSIEALYDQVFTTFNDIWSFGVLLFELVTLGAAPYPGIHNRDIPVLLKRGDRMQRPENCSEVLYAIMIACWHVCPEDRPSFTHLRNKLEALLEEDTPYLEFNQDYSSFPFAEVPEDPDSDRSDEAEEEEDEEVEVAGDDEEVRAGRAVPRPGDIPLVFLAGEGGVDEAEPAGSPRSDDDDDDDDVFADTETGSLALLAAGRSPATSGRSLPYLDGPKAGEGHLQKRDSGLGSEDLYSSRHANMEDVPLM